MGEGEDGGGREETVGGEKEFCDCEVGGREEVSMLSGLMSL